MSGPHSSCLELDPFWSEQAGSAGEEAVFLTGRRAGLAPHVSAEHCLSETKEVRRGHPGKKGGVSYERSLVSAPREDRVARGWELPGSEKEQEFPQTQDNCPIHIPTWRSRPGREVTWELCGGSVGRPHARKWCQSALGARVHQLPAPGGLS